VEDILRVKSKHASTRGWMSKIEDDRICSIMRMLLQHTVVEVTDPAAVENTYVSCAPSMDSFMREDSGDSDNEPSGQRNRSFFTNFDVTLDETDQSFITDRSVLECFKTKYCHAIRKLQISWNGKFQTQQELDFYQSLIKLEHLVLELIDKLESPCYNRALSTPFPIEALNNLRVLEILSCDSMSYFLEFIRVCPNLVHLCIPKFQTKSCRRERRFAVEMLEHLQSNTGNKIEELSGSIAGFLCLSPLLAWNATEADYRLFQYIEDRNIKLICFDADILSMIFIRDTTRSTTTLNSIISLEGIVEEIKNFSMPNLVEILDKDGLWEWSATLEDDIEAGRIQAMLSRLKSFKIIYDSPNKDNKDLLSMIIGNGTCSSLEDLNIKVGRKTPVSILPQIDWCASFPSLKSLEFKSHKLEGLAKMLSTLSRIPTLEILSLESENDGEATHEQSASGHQQGHHLVLLNEVEFQSLLLMRGWYSFL
jgi:hypothetical protein